MFFAGGKMGLVEAEVIAEVHKPGASCGTVAMVVVRYVKYNYVSGAMGRRYRMIQRRS